MKYVLVLRFTQYSDDQLKVIKYLGGMKGLAPGFKIHTDTESLASSIKARSKRHN